MWREGSQPGPANRRSILLAVLSAALVLALATAGVAVLRPGPFAGWFGAASSRPNGTPQPSESVPSPVLAGVSVDAPGPTAAGLRAKLDAAVGDSGLGSRVHLSVRDVVTGASLYDRGADVPTMPASTIKIATAAAVLAARGPGHRIPTRVVAGSSPGEVVLIGGGDPTLAIDGTRFYPGAARLDELAEQVKVALGEVKPTKVVFDATTFSGPAFGPGWDDDIPTGGYASAITALMVNGGRVTPGAARGWAQRSTAPDLAAGRAFAAALGVPAQAVHSAPAGYTEQLGTPAEGATGSAGPAAGGVAVGTGARGPIPRAAAGSPSDPGARRPTLAAPGTELGRVESPPMIRIVESMLVDSDNVVAEALARQVAIARGEPASFTGAAVAMKAVLADLGLPVGQSTLADGSGLSRRNRLPPSLLTGLLVLAADGARPEIASLFSGLPVAAWSGTLQTRFRGRAMRDRPGAGVVRAKTGSLSGVNALAGTVTTADGRLLAFAVLADEVPLDLDAAQLSLDEIASVLAGCGCR